MSRPTPRVAPNFVALSTIGEIELYAWLGSRTALIAFCADEALLDALSTLAERAAELGLAILVVCGASLQALLQYADRRRIQGAHAIEFPLIADPEGVIASAYGFSRIACAAAVVEVGCDRTVRQVHRLTDASGDWHALLQRRP